MMGPFKAVPGLEVSYSDTSEPKGAPEPVGEPGGPTVPWHCQWEEADFQVLQAVNRWIVWRRRQSERAEQDESLTEMARDLDEGHSES